MTESSKEPSNDDAASSKSEAVEAARDEGDTRPRSDVPKTMGLRIARGLLAPLLVLGAVGVHFWLNVPDDKVIVPPKKSGKKGPAKRRFAERNQAQMDQSWKRWSPEPFDGEPIKGKWGRRQQTIVNKAVVLARQEAFEKSPEKPRVVVSGTQCRTIRCRFVLRSPFRHELESVVATMKRQRFDGAPLWRSVEFESIEPPTPQSPRDDHYFEVTVGVNMDGVEGKDIKFAPAPKKAPKKAPAKAP